MSEIIKSFGINLPTILYVLLNAVILVAGISLLLIRPVKKIMAERKAKADEVYKENERLKKEASEARLKYEKLSEEAAAQIREMMNKSEKEASESAAKIIEEAKRKAQELLQSSKREIEAERLSMEQQFKDEITTLALDIAARVLEREVKESDNAKLVSEALNRWNSNASN